MEEKKIKELEDFSSKKLVQEDLDRILSLYGSDVEDIFDLTGGQQWMLRKAKHVKDMFFLQMMFKAKMEFNPVSFRQKVDEISYKRENLRSVFVVSDVKNSYRVVLKNRRAEIRLVNIENVPIEKLDDKMKECMEEDRNRGFDIEIAPLFRITILKTCEKDYYAIIMSQPHINSDGQSIMLLVQELFLGLPMEMFSMGNSIDNLQYKNYAKWLNSIDTDKELNYWGEVMDNAPKLYEIPGHYQSSAEYVVSTYDISLNKDIVEKLLIKQKEFGATQFNVLQTLWGIMLSKLYGVNDILYATITSGRDMQVPGSSTMTGGFIGVIPVRLRIENNESVKAIIKKIQKQFGYSMMNSHVSTDEISDYLKRKEPLFNHIINCHNFTNATTDITKVLKLPGIEFMGVEAYDNLSEDLCLYLQPQKEKIVLRFAYNNKSFYEGAIELLVRCYFDIINQVANGDENISYDQINVRSINEFDKLVDEGKKEKIYIKEFIRGLSFFSKCDEDSLDEIVNSSTVMTYSIGDSIIANNQVMKNVAFVYNGKLLIYKEGKNGWLDYSPIAIKNVNSAISTFALIPGEKSFYEYVAAENETKILSVPCEKILNCMKKNQNVSLEFMRDLLNNNKIIVSLI